MKLSKSDVARLYKGPFFLIGDKKSATQPVEEIPPQAVPEVEEATPAPPIVEKTPSPVAEASPPLVVSEPTPPTVEKGPFQHGTPVVWKTRPTAQISLIISESEFRNKLLTTGLKTCVEAAGIDIKQVGFGLLKTASEVSDFREMPTDVAIIFSPPPPNHSPTYELPSGKKLYFFVALKDIVMEIANQEKLIELLKRIRG